MHTKDNQFLNGALTAAACFLLVYLAMIFRFAPFTDEIWDWSADNWGIYLAGGRYTVTLIRSIFSACGVPVAYGIAASVFWGCSIAVQMEILQVRNPWLRFLFIAFSVGVVQLSYLMTCSFLVDAVCLGLLCCSLAYWFFDQWLQDKRKHKLALSVFLGVLGVGSYQFLAMMLPICFCGVALLRAERDKTADLFRRGLLFVGWSVAILICYFLVAKTCNLLCSAEDLAIVNSYQETLILWGQLDLVSQVLHIGKQWVMHLIGISYPGEWVYAISFIALIVVILDICKSVGKRSERFVYVFLAISLYVLPFLPIAVLGDDKGARLFLAQPTSCAILCTLAVAPRIRHFPTWLLATCGCFFVLKACYVVSDASFYQKRRFEQALVLRAELYANILNAPVPPDVNLSSCPIVVQGSLITPLVEKDIYCSVVSMAGDSLLEQYLGIQRWSQANKRDPQQVREFQNMPVYPAPGSIRYWNGKILVKLH